MFILEPLLIVFVMMNGIIIIISIKQIPPIFLKEAGLFIYSKTFKNQ
jgi:hypothetical protein